MWKKRKHKSRFSNNLFKLFVIFFILLVFASILTIVEVKLFSVKKIDVKSGRLDCVNENQLKDSSQVLQKNFFLLDVSRTEDNLKKKFFCIKSVVISKSLPDKIKITVSGRQGFAAMVSLKDKPASISSLIENTSTSSAGQVQGSYLVDDEGVVFSKQAGDLDLQKIYVYNSVISLGKKLETTVLNSLKILNRIKDFGMVVKQGWIIDELFLVDSGDSGPKVVFHSSDNIDVQLASLQLILAEAKIDLKKLEFIDLRFDKPIVRFAPKKNG